MIDAYWSAGALDAHEGQSVYSKPGGGTRVGERLTDLPLTLRSDPAMPGQLASPFVMTGASSRMSSVFDNGARSEPTDWIRDGALAALIQTRHSAAADRAAVHAVRATTSSWSAATRAATSTTWWPRPTAACC